MDAARSVTGIRPRRLSRVVGITALFSGAALLAQIVAGLPLRLGLAASAGTLLIALVIVRRRSSADGRRWFRGVVKVGIVAGLAATAAYDLTRYVLSLGEASPYNPFEAIRAFGMLLAGPQAAPAVIYASGAAFHILNGISFGVAFCFFFGRRGVLAGIGWGLFLELFQLALYPGWLDIKAIREFQQISALGHVAYGAVLGLMSRRGLIRESEQVPASMPAEGGYRG